MRVCFTSAFFTWCHESKWAHNFIINIIIIRLPPELVPVLRPLEWWRDAHTWRGLALLQYSSTLGMPDSVYARFDIVSDTCHPAPCYLNSNKVFLLLSDRYCNPEWWFKPGTQGILFTWIWESALDHTATTAGLNNLTTTYSFCSLCRIKTVISESDVKKAFQRSMDSMARLD